MTWKGDHLPRHVHVFRDGHLIVKWNLESNIVMEGKITRRLKKLINELEKEGAL